MSWTITYGSTIVTLPQAPQEIDDKGATVDDTSLTVPESEPVLVSIGSDVRTLTLKGFMMVAGQSLSYLDTNYVSPILSMRGYVVTLATPRPSLNGNWKLDNYEFVESQKWGTNQALEFTLDFKHASSYVIL